MNPSDYISDEALSQNTVLQYFENVKDLHAMDNQR